MTTGTARSSSLRTTAANTPRKREAQDAVAVLRADHRTVEGLFTRFESAGPRALRTKRSLVDRLAVELTVHAAVEEAILYPAARAEVPDTESEVLEALEEHHVVKWQPVELEKLDPKDERFDAKVAVLMENVRHHVSEEEDTLFPALRKHLTRAHLVELGKELRSMRPHVPTHPHPRALDTPPAKPGVRRGEPRPGPSPGPGAPRPDLIRADHRWWPASWSPRQRPPARGGRPSTGVGTTVPARG